MYKRKLGIAFVCMQMQAVIMAMPGGSHLVTLLKNNVGEFRLFQTSAHCQPRWSRTDHDGLVTNGRNSHSSSVPQRKLKKPAEISTGFYHLIVKTIFCYLIV